VIDLGHAVADKAICEHGRDNCPIAVSLVPAASAPHVVGNFGIVLVDEFEAAVASASNTG
jgi:hypothetical protein